MFGWKSNKTQKGLIYPQMSYQALLWHLKRFFCVTPSLYYYFFCLGCMPLLYGWWIPVLFWELHLWTPPQCPSSDELWSVYLLCCNELFIFSFFLFSVSIRPVKTDFNATLVIFRLSISLKLLQSLFKIIRLHLLRKQNMYSLPTIGNVHFS